MDRERDHRDRQQAIRGSVAALRRQDHREKDALDGAEKRGYM
jgi:hypothetical protein